jgi:hypothetical protein
MCATIATPKEKTKLGNEKNNKVLLTKDMVQKRQIQPNWLLLVVLGNYVRKRIRIPIACCC